MDGQSSMVAYHKGTFNSYNTNSSESIIEGEIIAQSSRIAEEEPPENKVLRLQQAMIDQ